MSVGGSPADFPSITVHPERVLYRIHRAVNEPVSFSSSGDGRFDLTAVPGFGTCYLSTSSVGAYVEVFGRFGTISESDVAERSLAEIALSRPLTLANLTDRTVLGRFGIAGDMSTGADYTRSQTLAAQLYQAGFDGIYYTARHDPAFSERSLAVFGGPGEAKMLVANVSDIPQDLIDDCATEFGLLVLPDPV